MSKFGYEQSKSIVAQGYAFDSLLMALMRQADTDNIQKLKSVFPNEHAELQERYNSPGGWLSTEQHPFVPSLDDANYCGVTGCGRTDDNH